MTPQTPQLSLLLNPCLQGQAQVVKQGIMKSLFGFNKIQSCQAYLKPSIIPESFGGPVQILRAVIGPTCLQPQESRPALPTRL
jgi:hypothetical protein